ncbi:MAG: PAS domain S-box protein [Ignavibacteriales bacterium]|nr:PAS domain S-box protein [Ignavibacteriales bacterium]
MSLKKQFLIVFGIQLLMVSGLGLLSHLLFRNQQNLSKSQESQFHSYLLADELRKSTEELSRLANAYIATGNPDFENEYWALINIRNGKSPRPFTNSILNNVFVTGTDQSLHRDSITISLLDLILRETFTSIEIAKLSEAYKNSEELVKLEQIAMNAAAGLFDDGSGRFLIRKDPDRNFSIHFLHDTTYIGKKTAFIKHLAEFHAMFAERASQEIANYNHTSTILLREIMVLVAINMGMFLLSFITIRRQINERQTAEDKLKVFANTFMSINDAVNIADLNDRIIFVNPAFCRTYGYSETELFGRDSSVFWSDCNSKEIISQILPATLAGGWKGELFNRRKDGSDFPIHLSTAVIKNDKGTPIAMVGIVQDITEERESAKIKNSLYEISQAVNQTKDIDSFYLRIHEIVKELMPADNFYIALHDQETDMISFPYFVDEIDQPGPPQKFGKGCTEYVLKTGEAIVFTTELFDELCASGQLEIVGVPSKVWLGVPLKVSGITFGVIVVQSYDDEYAYEEKDKQIIELVSEQVALATYKKLMEEKLKRYTDELVGLNAAKDKLFSIIAHDLRSPFHGLLGLTEMMSDPSEDFPSDKYKQYSSQIHTSVEYLYKLIENLLEWAQVQKGSISFDQKKINLYELSLKSILTTTQRASKKNIQIINEIPLDINIFADEKMTDSVLRNILSNAVKFTKHCGQITIGARVIKEAMIEIAIKDTGVGIPAKIAEKLFVVGEKTATRGTDNEPSTGLGLILCKEFVEKNGGNIWIASEENVGSTFYFTVPRA